MNRDQKAAAIAEIADHIRESEAVFAVDYKGISVPQAAELRAKLRESDATFKVVKNSLTERAADEAGAPQALKELLQGPTALTFVRGDIATAAKSIADYGRAIQLLPFKGGLMDGAALDSEQIRSLSRLPSREALYGQLVGIVASPVSGLVRTLGGLVGGLAVALGQVQAKKESGEIPAGDPPAAEEPAVATEPAPAEEPEAEAEAATTVESSPAEAETEVQTEPEQSEPAPSDDNQADVSAETQSEDAETNPTPKED